MLIYASLWGRLEWLLYLYTIMLQHAKKKNRKILHVVYVLTVCFGTGKIFLHCPKTRINENSYFCRCPKCYETV